MFFAFCYVALFQCFLAGDGVAALIYVDVFVWLFDCGSVDLYGFGAGPDLLFLPVLFDLLKTSFDGFSDG